MEKVNDNYVQGNAEFFIFSCHTEHLVLRPVAQFALPESKELLVNHGCSSGYLRVIFKDFCRIVINRNPIVELLCGFCLPLGIVFAKYYISNTRMIPQEAIAQTGHCKGDGCLRIALCKLQGTAFQVEIGLLVLSHSVNFLSVIALEAQLHHIVAADNCLVFPPADSEASAFAACWLVVIPVILFQDFLSVTIKGHNTGRVHLDAETSVSDDGAFCF